MTTQTHTRQPLLIRRCTFELHLFDDAPRSRETQAFINLQSRMSLTQDPAAMWRAAAGLLPSPEVVR